MSRVLVGLVALFLTCACSSSYEPARSPRITTVMEDGWPTFVKDGARYGTPAFGVGLVDAVQGNPRAEEQARIGRNLAIGGFVFDMVGLGSEIGGLVALEHDQLQHQPSTLATGLVFGGLGAVLVGSVMLLNAQPHIYDAVNIYNDGIDSGPR
jgi:hypothetical protein